MALSPAELAAAARLAQYNSGKITAANPLGLGQGGQRNYLAAADDLALFGNAIVRETIAQLTQTTDLVDQMNLLALMVEGGPVVSVNGQTGVVTIDLSSLSAEIEEQLEGVRDAQRDLEAKASSTLAYSLAF